ncbi:hypothetical protein CCACVL1_26967 [Corchorus capsularis]|uniref:Neprosin PEP catalytic domain-containing protein n=1 Tax=Corchorus capsularis TaxID=210143 RepID=A0A1R3GCR4_COCAP|nr:hypothetical protein CCACVL1_26967 [Corchorus capsularis]
MDYKSLITITIALAMLCNHGVSTRGLSGMNETEFMAESKSINRHATIKTIKTQFGDIFDCVDIYKQPSLLHPLLKNHKIQMRPSYLKRNSTEDSISTESNSLPSNLAKMFGLGKGCPKGTVPIRRKVVKEGITRSINAYAGIVIHPDEGKRFKGAAAGLNVYQPSPVVSGQFSGALIEVFAGYVSNVAYIHTGWMVNPSFYGDAQTRFFIEWQEETDGEISGCFDMECPGFVQVDTNLPVGAAFSKVSKINGEQIVSDMRLTMVKLIKPLLIYVFY